MIDEELYYKVFPDGCWHENEVEPCSVGSVRYPCSKCGSSDYNPDFSTWSGFGVLWEGMEKHERWQELLDFYRLYYCRTVGVPKLTAMIVIEQVVPLINPTRFRDACKEFFSRDE